MQSKVRNDLRGEYEIEIGGQMRLFRFSMMEAYNLDKQSRVSLMQLNESNISFVLLMDILHMGLRVHDPKLKLETVAMWLTEQAEDMASVFEFVGVAIANIMNRGGKAEAAAEGGDAPLARADAAAQSHTASSSARGDAPA